MSPAEVRNKKPKVEISFEEKIERKLSNFITAIRADMERMFAILSGGGLSQAPPRGILDTPNAPMHLKGIGKKRNRGDNLVPAKFH